MGVFVADALDFLPSRVGLSRGLSTHNGIESDTLTTEHTAKPSFFFLPILGWYGLQRAFALR